MPKDTTTNKEKKTMWSRFTSWLATTWLGKALSTVKSWFSSSDATKANATNSPASEVPSNDREVPAQRLDKGQETKVAQDHGQEDEVDPVGNNLSTTDPLAAENPAEPTPSNGTPATPLSGSAGPATGGESDMQETNQNPVQSDSMPVGGMGATSQQGFKAFIKIDGENLRFVPMHKDTTDYIRGCKNPANGKECLVYVKHGEDMYRIIFTGDRKINSIAKQHKSTQHMNDNAINPNNNMESAKTLFGLNETAPSVEITEISNVPFEAPEVKSSKTTENGSEIKKESEAKESANVVDTGSTQGNPQPQPQGDSKGETGTAETEPKSPVLVVNGEDSSPKAAESSTEQPAATGGQFEDVIDIPGKQPQVSGAATTTPKGGTGTAGPKVESLEDQGKDQQEEGQKVESNPESAAVGEAGQQDKGGNPVVTPSVTEGSPQPQPKVSEDHKDGTGAATTTPKGEDKAAGTEPKVESTEGQDHGQQLKKDKALPLEDEKRDPEAANSSNVPPAPIEDQSAEGGQEPESKAPEGQEDEQVKGIKTPAPRTTSADLKSEHVPSTNGKPRT